MLVPRRSALLLALFRLYARHYLRRHFHAVRLARAGLAPVLPEGPVLIVLNHPSWWDPLIGFVLAEQFEGRSHFAPIDSGALVRYRFLGRLGLFGIEPGTLRGARDFLQIGEAILAQPDRALWVTAQGEFTDARLRPPGLRSGIAHLAHRFHSGWVVPLALEYAFWNERLPEALARFGAPIPIAEGRALTAKGWLGLIEDRLAQTQDALARETQARAPSAFVSLLEGSAGVGGIYDLWRRLATHWRGERFRAEHEDRSFGDVA